MSATSWRPVSPVSGRLDAFQWQTPVAALPSDKSAAIDAKEFNEAGCEAMSTPRRVEPPREPVAEVTAPAAQDNSPIAPAKPAAVEPAISPARPRRRLRPPRRQPNPRP